MENRWNDKAILAAVRKRLIDKLDVAGKFVEDSAKLLVAVDTGNLRGSITHKVDEVELSCRIGTNVEYAPYLEFGTGEFAENGQGRKGGWFFRGADGKTHFTLGNQPQPFLRPALLENKDAIKKMLEL